MRVNGASGARKRVSDKLLRVDRARARTHSHRLALFLSLSRRTNGVRALARTLAHTRCRSTHNGEFRWCSPPPSPFCFASERARRHTRSKKLALSDYPITPLSGPSPLNSVCSATVWHRQCSRAGDLCLCVFPPSLSHTHTQTHPPTPSFRIQLPDILWSW